MHIGGSPLINCDKNDMKPFYSPLAGRQPFWESQNFEESCDILNQLIGPHQSVLDEDLARFFCRYYFGPLYQSHMVYLQWSARQTLTRTQSPDVYVLYIPLDGNIEECVNHHELTRSSPDCAHLFSPEQLLQGHLPSQGQGISVCLPKSLVLAECQKTSPKTIKASLGLLFRQIADVTNLDLILRFDKGLR